MNDQSGKPIKDGETDDYGTAWAISVNPADRSKGAEMFNDFEDAQPPGNPKARVRNARDNADAVINFVAGKDRNPIRLTASDADKAKFYYTNALVNRLGYNTDTQNIFLYGTKSGDTTELFATVNAPPPGYDYESLKKNPARLEAMTRGLPPAVVGIMTRWMRAGKIR